MEIQDVDLLFPPCAIPSLRELRGRAWQELVEFVWQQAEDSLPRMGFVLMMVRLGACTTCHVDSFRALKGCTQCAIQSVRRYRGSDQELRGLYDEACSEVDTFLKSKQVSL